MSTLMFVKLILGLLLLVVGAELLVRGAARIAARLGISPLIVGLTIVAFGTGAPELAVSVQAALSGSGDIALGNAVGHNIFNALVILGLSALITPLTVSRQQIRFSVPVMIGASLLAFALVFDQRLDPLDSSLLLGAFVMYTVTLIHFARQQTKQPTARAINPANQPQGWLKNALLVLSGIGLLLLGSDWLVDGAVILARALGLSELLIGLTLIAAGTALPELATSLLAAFRGQREIAVGNIVGSNIFNMLAVLGVTGLVSELPISVSPNLLALDFPVMLGITVACLPMFVSQKGVSRTAGVVLLGYYLAYVAYLALFNTGRPSAQPFGDALLSYALPLTAAVLLILVARAWRTQR